MSVVMRNSYKNPRAMFVNRDTAKRCCAYINDYNKNMQCSYYRHADDDQLWIVESDGIELPEFVKLLHMGGFKPL